MITRASMEFLSFGLIAVTLIVVMIHIWLRKKEYHFPPCPSRPLPIVGHLFLFSSDRRSLLRKWREKCGDIYSLYMGSKMVVVLNGYDLIKETLVKRGEDFSDRPHTYFDTVTRYPQKGIFSSSGKVWKEQRAVSLNILRTFGFGKNILAEKVQHEVNHYISYLSGNTGKPTDINMVTSMSTSNIMCSILFGQRFEYTDKRFQKLMTYLNQLLRDFTTTGIVNVFPCLRFLPGDLFHLKKAENNIKEMLELFEIFIENSRRGNYEENFISVYTAQMRVRMQNGDTSMNEDNLRRVIFDLFGAGTETTSKTIYIFIMYMLHHPDVQKKIFAQINENIGSDRSPAIQDRPKLTYLHAAIMETQRLASINPLSFPHTCPRDVIVQGYTIPKGSIIMPCLDSVLHDEKVWGHDVMSFRPERFIDQDGQIKHYDELIPFSVGRRSCLGESMAKTELFLYLANMIQKFEFLPVDPGHPPPINLFFGAGISLLPYECQIVARFQ